MAVITNPIFPQTILSKVATFVNADGTTIKQLVPAQTNAGAKIENIPVTSTDTVARLLSLYYQVSSVNYLIGTVSIPAGAGTDGVTPTVNLIAALASGVPLIPAAVDERGNLYLYLDTGTSLYAGMGAPVTAAKTVTVVASGGAF